MQGKNKWRLPQNSEIQAEFRKEKQVILDEHV